MNDEVGEVVVGEVVVGEVVVGEVVVGEVVYEVARYRRDEDDDELIGQIQIVVGSDGGLIVRGSNGSESRSEQNNPKAVIAGDPELHSVSPYEVTQLRGLPAVVDELPLLLRVQDEGHPPESYEVFVDDPRWDERWDLLETTGGYRFVPDGYLICDEARLPDEWVVVRCAEPAPVVARLGLITPRVIADLCVPGGDEARLSLHPRGDDAESVADWLVHGTPGRCRLGSDAAGSLRDLFAAGRNDGSGDGSAGSSVTVSLEDLGDGVVRGILDRLDRGGVR